MLSWLPRHTGIRDEDTFATDRKDLMLVAASPDARESNEVSLLSGGFDLSESGGFSESEEGSRGSSGGSDVSFFRWRFARNVGFGGTFGGTFFAAVDSGRLIIEFSLLILGVVEEAMPDGLLGIGILLLLVSAAFRLWQLPPLVFLLPLPYHALRARESLRISCTGESLASPVVGAASTPPTLTEVIFHGTYQPRDRPINHLTNLFPLFLHGLSLFDFLIS